MTTNTRSVHGIGRLVALLWLGARAACAAPMCEIDPTGHGVTVIQDGTERGGIGGTGVRLAAAPIGGIGGTGSPAATTMGQGGLGGSGSPRREPNTRQADNGGGIGGTGAVLRVPLAGTVMFAHGTVVAMRGQDERKLDSGAPVCEGDSIETRQASLVQLAMADGGRLDVRALSRLHLDTFIMPAHMDGSERFSATLAWGSLQATTGEIGHLHKALYALHTPVADIGIRGTVHEVFHIPNPLPGAPAGTYDRVLEGGTVLANGTRALSLAPNQTGFVSADRQPPRRLDRLPPPLIQMATPLATGKSTKQDATTTAPASGDDVALYIRPLKIIDETFDLSTVAAEGSALVGVSQDLANSLTVAGGAISRHRNGSVIVLDPDWGIPIAAADTRNGFSFLTTDNSSLYDLGYATVDGVDVVWGLYGATTAVDPVTGAIKPYDFHHFAFAAQGVTPQAVLGGLSGTATFNQIIGGTMLTDEGGGIGGQVNSLAIGVAFGAKTTITSYQITATDSQSRNWSGQYTGSMGLAAFRAGQMALSVQCQGDGCGGGTGSGTAAGIIIGQGGKGLITSYGLHTASGQSVAGAAVVARP